MAITIPQTQTILLSYFMTSDVPTQDQFAELIGTMFYLYGESVANTEAAAASAAAAAASLTALEAQIPQVMCRISFDADTDAFSFIGAHPGASTVTFPGNIRITFTTPFADANYKIFFGDEEDAPTIATKNAAYIEFSDTEGPWPSIALFA